MTNQAVGILGAGMTDMGRRDLEPDQLVHLAVTEALAEAQVAPHELGLVLVGNALGGELCDQGCIRGQAWLRKTDLGDAGVVNVDNSCAGGASALHLGVQAVSAGERPVLVAGVEKMWTGDRAATIAGIEQGLPGDYRDDVHRMLLGPDNPAGSALMGLNDAWARQYLEERRGRVEHVAAAAVKARRHASLNPLAQVHTPVTVEEVLAAPKVAGLLTRLMCSSFTDGAAALVLAPATSRTASQHPRIIGSVLRSGAGQLDYHERMEAAASDAYEAFSLGPSDFDVVELHDATSAEELYALECLGFFEPGEAGWATAAGHTAVGGRAVTVNPSGGLVGRGHPLGATGVAQVVELVRQLQGTAGARQVEGARLGLAVNSGGIVGGDAAVIAFHALSVGA